MQLPISFLSKWYDKGHKVGTRKQIRIELGTKCYCSLTLVNE